MAVCNVKLRNSGLPRSEGTERPARRPRRPALAWPRLVAAAAAGALTLFDAMPAEAQHQPGQPSPLVNPPSQYIPCTAVGQALVRVPELISHGGRLRGTILLSDGPRRMDLNIGPDKCVPQFVRYFCGVAAVLPGYAGANPPNFPYCPSPQPVDDNYSDPLPGPTLRARVGDVVELTFLNHIDPLDFGDSIDRGEQGQGCDESSKPYPGKPPNPHDTYPDCFHGSSTGNIHFHGTHTSPSTTGDNVFVEVRPSPRDGRAPIVTEESVKEPFADFFSACEIRLRNDALAQWPKTWADLPSAWTDRQEALLKAYDSDPTILNKLWPIDAAQLKEGAWPQYYIGAYPYCFRLPRYTEPTRPPAPAAGHHAMHAADAAQRRVLQMGQAPGTHWYHAHKHGSTTINVMNGMTGAFIVEGPYDDTLNSFYGDGWARQQPVLIINEYGVSPKLFGGGNTLPLSVNGRREPRLTMRPGEVQLWRIVNTSARSGVYFVSPPRLDPKNYDPAKDLQWKQTAQDGVQFTGGNYDGNQNFPFLLAAGNRADLLVKAPANQTGQPQVYTLQVRPAIRAAQTQQGTGVTLLTVQVESAPSVDGNPATFIPADQLGASFPPFLADITPEQVKGTKKIVFESADPPGATAPSFTTHTIDGKKFDGKIGQVVLLNTVEEWKIENRTLTKSPTGAIDHPFHIHINPFQVVEVFSPNQTVTNVAGQTVPKFVFYNTPAPDSAQCYLDPFKPEMWKDCHADTPSNIWWDVFPIPSAIIATDANGSPLKDPKTGTQIVVPGYFKMRSRFVDYAGQYVMHCHILAHEDRGMMTIVEVTRDITPYSHQ
jgi:FtsP/CotA-like multicopper oxidase with cupredoxin domain